MFGLGPQELIIILVVALIIFGPKKLPEVGRMLGKAISTVNQASKTVLNEIQEPLEQEESKPDKSSKKKES